MRLKDHSFRDDDSGDVQDRLVESVVEHGEMYKRLFDRLAKRAKQHGFVVVYGISASDPLSLTTVTKLGKSDGSLMECSDLAGTLDRWLKAWIDE